MRIVLSGSGFIDTANAFAESAKLKLLKNILVLSRDRYFVERMDKRVRLLDYSRMESDIIGTPLQVERNLMKRIKARLADELSRSGDILYIATCEPSELAALPVIQEICREEKMRFHLFLVAPFAFQGRKPAEMMRDMLGSVGEDYSSISLYFADELLRIDRKNNPDEPFTMQDAYDALEKTVVDIAKEMFRQIPRLDRSMQYTFDFNWNQFSLAVDPLDLVTEMWKGVVNDKTLYPGVTEDSSGEEMKGRANEENAAQNDADDGVRSQADTGGQVSTVEKGKLSRLVGILNPNRENEKRKSAYTVVKKNTIPLTVYREQVGETRINEFVDKIRSYVSGDTDPEFRKKAEERLRREISKFQVRQEEAERKYLGNQPTVVLGVGEAVASVYMDDSILDSAEEATDSRRGVKKMSMETPYQRAARTAAQYRDKPVSWAEIAKSKQKAISEASEEMKAVESDAERQESIQASVVPVAADETESLSNPQDMPQKKEPEKTASAEMPASNPVLSGAELRESIRKLSESSNIHIEIAKKTKPVKAEEKEKPVAENTTKHTALVSDEENSSIDNNVHEIVKQELSEDSSQEGIMDFIYKPAEKADLATDTERSAKKSASVDSGITIIGARDRESERARKKAEKQAAKISKKLAKAEEKAALAAEKAAQAKREVEIIAREKNS